MSAYLPKSDVIASVARSRQAVATLGGKALALPRSAYNSLVHQQGRGVPDLAGDARRTRFRYREPRSATLAAGANLKIDLNSKARNGLSKSWLTPSIRFTT